MIRYNYKRLILVTRI